MARHLFLNRLNQTGERRSLPGALAATAGRNRRGVRLGHLLLWGIGCIWPLVCPAMAADRLILRNLEVITGRTVVSFDENGVRLDNGTLLGWDELEGGSVATKQDEFQQMIRDVGEPLFRIRQRLLVGDVGSLDQPSALLWPRYRTSRGPVAYRVAICLAWSRMARGQREQAVVPVVWAMEARRAMSEWPAEAWQLPGPRQPRWDPQTGLLLELLPVAWQPEAAGQVLDELGATVGRMQRPLPLAARIYYATLASAAGQFERAANALDSSEPQLAWWRGLIELEQALAEGRQAAAAQWLSTQWPATSGPMRVAALFGLGRYYSAQQDRQAERGLLLLVRLAAERQSNDDPEPAAAALLAAMKRLEDLKDAAGSARLHAEILTHFGNTRIGRQLAAEKP
ncbi:MAG: hypothetical protein KatS3mg082_3438 [Nitrospiraceae bacterium]|nr:MAG: hypothetical protein KatS3mg082_3438 [Nitrospiraceae bacterium]